MMRHALVFPVVLLLASACAAPPEPASPPIDTVEQLVAALRQAGVEVDETAMIPTAIGLPGGQVILVGPERVEVYPFETEALRQQAQAELLLRPWDESAPNLWGRGRLIVAYPGDDGPTIALLSGFLGDVLDLPGQAAVEPYPPAVAAGIAWLADSLGEDPSSLAVLDYAPADWPDACLGLAGPDELCLQVITPGWRIVLQAGDVEVILRSDELGNVIRREP